MSENKARAGWILLTLFCLGTFVAAADRLQWKRTTAKDGNVVIVKNPREPIHKDAVLMFKEDFTIGGAEAKGEYAFTSPRSMAADKEGNLYVLDVRDSCIKVFDSSAKYLRTIGRRGQGPGEIGGGMSMTLLPEKAEIFVFDASNRRLSVFNINGSFLKQLPVRGLVAEIKIDTLGNIYILDGVFGQGGREDVLKKLNPDMNQVLAEFIRHPQDERPNPFSPRDYWILDSKDRLIYGDGKTYEIRYFSSDGQLIRRVLRDYELLKVTQKDIDEFGDRRIPGSGAKIDYNFSSHHGAYRSFFADDLGHLFVQTWERTSDRRQDIHDIFDAEGRFIGRVALNRHADLINPKSRFIRDGKFYTIEPDKEGYEVIKRYSIEWKVK